MSFSEIHHRGLLSPRLSQAARALYVLPVLVAGLILLGGFGGEAMPDSVVIEDQITNDQANETEECVTPVNKQGEPDSGEGQPLIRIKVVNVENSEGNLMFSLYGDNPKTFMKYRTYLKKLHAPAVADETIVCIRAPNTGVFALTIYHDEDADRDFDRNFLGFPKEGYGFSNNPRIRFPLPRYKDVKFAVNDDETDLEIVLHY